MSAQRAHTHTHTYIYTLALQRKTTLSFMLFMCQGASAKTNPYHRPLTMILDTLNTDAQTYMFIQRCTEELFCLLLKAIVVRDIKLILQN